MNNPIADITHRLPPRHTQPADARAATHDFLVLNPHPDLTREAPRGRRIPGPGERGTFRSRSTP